MIFWTVGGNQSTENRIVYFYIFPYVLCIFKYLSSPNSNFPGPFLRKLPLIHVGIVPLIAVGIASGVSSTEVTRAAKLSSPLACGQRCQLGTEKKLAQSHVLHIYRNILSTPPQASSLINIYSLGPLKGLHEDVPSLDQKSR